MIVGIATGYGLDDRGFGVRVPEGSRIFSPPRRATGSGAYTISYLMGTEALSPRVQRPGREADHSPLAIVEVKKIWIYTSIPPYAFMP
jgi:hypothetical protein